MSSHICVSAHQVLQTSVFSGPTQVCLTFVLPVGHDPLNVLCTDPARVWPGIASASSHCRIENSKSHCRILYVFTGGLELS